MGSTSVKPPPPRDYYQETRDTLQAQVDLAPELYMREAQYRPKYAELDFNIARELSPRIAEMLSELQPTLDATQIESQRAFREADIAAVEELGPRATEAILASNPEAAALLKAMTAQANEEIASGGALTPGQMREAQQQIRAAQSARGVATAGPAAANQEVRFTAAESEALRRRQQAFAANVLGLNQAIAGDPFMQILGRPGMSPMVAQGTFAQGAAFNPGNMFNPESAYASDLHNTNFNADYNARIASANNTSGIIGGFLGGAGTALGGWLGRSK